MNESVRTGLAGGIATMLAALTLLPVFADREWMLPVAAAVALVVLVGMAARALRFHPVGVGAAQVVALFLWLGIVATPGLGVVPSGEWFTALAGVFSDGASAIQRYTTPAPTEPALVALTVGGVALVAIAVDVIAATLRAAPWTGLPLLSLYAVPSGLLFDGVPWTLFVPVAVGYLGLLVVENQHQIARWGRPLDLGRSGAGASAGGTAGARSGAASSVRTAALAANGRKVGAAVIGVAVLIPAVIPSLPSEIGWFGFGSGGSGGGGGRTIRTDNPIVDLQRDLRRGNNVEVLAYTTTDTTPDYIRLVTLDVFDGKTWKTSSRPVPKSQSVSRGLPNPPGLSAAVPREEVTMRVTVSDDLVSRWLPLPYPASRIDAPGDWRYDINTLDVVSADDGTDTQNLRYSVTTLDLDVDAQTLDGARRPPQPLERFTDVTDLSDAGERRLQELLVPFARAGSNFDKAVALQQWFRDPTQFAYDDRRKAGHSEEFLLDFLEDRSGYCEQFAATMAIMARMLGIPARVAVGYLEGSRQENGQYVVRAHDAHAWPELYFDGAGWIRFEPTPSSRTGAQPSWTTQPADTPDITPETPVDPGTDPSSTAAPDDSFDDAVGGPTGGTDTTGGSAAPWRLILPLLLLAGAAVTPALLARVTRRSRWARAGSDLLGQAEVAWAEVREAALDARHPWDLAESPRVTGRRLRPGLDDLAGAALERIVGAVERARYSRRPLAVESLRDDVAEVRDGLVAPCSRRVRLRAKLLPVASVAAFSRIGQGVTAALDWADQVIYGIRTRWGLNRRERETADSPGTG